MSEPTKWHCPGCRHTVVAVAVAMGHRCPRRRFTIVDFDEIPDSDAPST